MSVIKDREENTKVDELNSDSVLWKKPGAGYLGIPCWVVIVQREEPGTPCMLHDIDNESGCQETVSTAWTLPGETKAEALAALQRRDFTGAAYHLSECELFEEAPDPPPPELSECRTCGVPIALSGWVRLPYCPRCNARRKSKEIARRGRIQYLRIDSGMDGPCHYPLGPCRDRSPDNVPKEPIGGSW